MKSGIVDAGRPDLIDDEPPLERWRPLLDSGDEYERLAGVILIGQPGPHREERVARLRQCLDDRSTGVQLAAVESLIRLGALGEADLGLLARKPLGQADRGTSQVMSHAILEAEGCPPQAIDFGIAVTTVARERIGQVVASAVFQEEKKAVPELFLAISEAVRGLHAPPQKDVAPPENQAYPAPQRVVGEAKEPAVTEGDKSDEAGRLGRIRSGFAEPLPQEFDAAYPTAAKLLLLCHEEVAERLTAPLRASLHRAPQSTYEEKRATASWANAVLRDIGLAIRCPKTGNPAILIADLRAGTKDSSRFRLETTDERGRKLRTWSGSTLDTLDLGLRANEPRKEGPATRLGRG